MTSTFCKLGLGQIVLFFQEQNYVITPVLDRIYMNINLKVQAPSSVEINTYISGLELRFMLVVNGIQ